MKLNHIFSATHRAASAIMFLAVPVLVAVLRVLSCCQAQTSPTPTATISIQGNYNAPFDAEGFVEFRCTADANEIQWKLNDTFAGNQIFIMARNVTITPTLENRTDSGNYFSYLRIPARIENNNTSIQCWAYSIDTFHSLAYSKQAFLYIQGLLDPPPNLTLTEAGDQLTRILTWGAPETLDLTDIDPDIQFYQVCYNLSDDLTCINVSSSERREFRFPNVCVPLVFTVTAFNVVGEGEASSIAHNGSTGGCDEGKQGNNIIIRPVCDS